MWAVVKFSSNGSPVIFGITNVAYGEILATMANVEWVQVITGTGYLCVPGTLNQTIPPIKPAVLPPPGLALSS